MFLTNISLLLNKQCDAKCSYCDVWSSSRGLLKVDLDFLKEILDNIPGNSCVEISGGEPGLITNIGEVVNIIKLHRNTKKITINSNGLIRKQYPELLPLFDMYNEHYIEYIDGTKIKTFQQLEPYSAENYTNIIVPTNQTLNSLINNFEVFKNHGIFKCRYFFKTYVEKTKFQKYDYDLISKFTSTYSHLDTTSLSNDVNKNSYIMRQKCAKLSSNIFVDFETKEIGHCCVCVTKSKRIDYSINNLKDCLSGKQLNTVGEYCNSCIVYDTNKDKCWLNFVKTKESSNYFKE